MSKRVFDIVFSALGLIVLFPFLLLIWLAVLLEGGRPGLFLQQRVGRNGNPFHIVKFRTMTHRPGDEQGGFDAGNQCRVTKVGRFLRKTKLDELPQLWNVLKGEMALVGPRPEVQEWVDAYPEQWSRILTVRPGMTDPASILFRDEEERLARAADPRQAYSDEVLPRKLEIYRSYVGERSFLGDMRILIQTVWAVLKR